MSFKQSVSLNIKNVVGWKTRRKIVVFSIDDYGNIRLDSKEARDKMFEQGLKPANNFDLHDALEDENDLLGLYETLNSVKDKHGNHAVFTPFALSANIDFERMRETNYEEYHYELLPITFSKLKGYENVWKLWKEGIDKKLLVPQFHGREHLNVKVLMEALKRKDEKVMINFENRSYACISDTGYPTISFTAALDFDDFKENEDLKLILEDGMNRFEEVYGYKAIHFNPCGSQGYSKSLEPTLSKKGIKYIDTSRSVNEHLGKGSYKKVYTYTGKKNKLDQTYLVRNCVFEPGQDRGIDWVAYCLNQVEASFRWKQPANISSHRVNFSGHIEPKNRENGLSALKKLLKEIVRKWPDVEFMTSNELGDLITLKKQSIN